MSPEARQQRADPQDQAAALRALVHRARVEGAGVYLEPLVSLETWRAAAAPAQDLAIAEAGRRLGAEWECLGAREWWCIGREISIRDGTGGPWYRPFRISHRLGLFLHRPTGAEFSLVPGGWHEEPDPIESPWVEMDEEQRRAWESQRRYVRRSIPPLLVARWPVTISQDLNHTVGPEGFLSPGERGYIGEPLTGMSHADVSGWCAELGLRLPTAAEWTHLAAGGASTRFYFGDELDDSHAWHAGNSDLETLRPHPGERLEIEQDAPIFSARHINSIVPVRGPQRTTIRYRGREYELVSTTATADGPNSYEVRGEPRAHAPAEHDAAKKWSAFGLVDVIGNVWEWLADNTGAGGGYHTDPNVFADLLRLNAPRSAGEAEVGFRPVAEIPGWGEV